MDKSCANLFKNNQVYKYRVNWVSAMVLRFGRGIVLTSFISVFATFGASGAYAEDFTSAAYQLAVAEATQDDKDLAKFYQETGYQPLWTEKNSESRVRRNALFDFLETADLHGLPRAKYGIDALKAQTRSARTQADLAVVEVALSKAFLTFARDLQTGVLIPKEVDRGIVRKVPYRERISYLTALADSNSAAAYFRSIAPSSAEYNRLAAEKFRLRKILAGGDWGQDVPGGGLLREGDRDDRVTFIRNRLIVLGYLNRSFGTLFDEKVESAIVTFQEDHGLQADGIVGASTTQMLNWSAEDRLKAVMVAMERERWINMDLGQRHVLVNLADYSTKIFEDGEITFQTKSIVGDAEPDRQSPEFSDEIEHMVVNPTWNIPRSIATRLYLPQLKQDSSSLDYLNFFDKTGAAVDPTKVDFSQITRENFPFDMKQPPSDTNALGLVKFMFPNRYNIYLHDTPTKALFGEETRAFSYGCVRLQDPFDFAFALLSVQSDNPEKEFLDTLATGVETVLPLKKHLPVHLIYRTAVGSPDGGMQYRRDVYGRDAKIWNALEQAGVELTG
jgi:murein L,D-transpeptidase YcbB/YkuD